MGLDTSVFIYYLNKQEPYYPLCREILKRIEAGQHRAFISTVTGMEMLVQPLATGDTPVVDAIQSLLSELSNLEIVPVDGDLAHAAADVRARMRLRSIDAIIVATAIIAGCDALIGNDETCARRVSEIPYIYFDDAVKEANP